MWERQGGELFWLEGTSEKKAFNGVAPFLIKPPTIRTLTTLLIPMMSTAENVKKLLAQTLQLGPRADALTADSALLGALPELDSMAVVTILTAMEEYFGFSVEDDEISADTFETFGSLVAFVEAKLGS